MATTDGPILADPHGFHYERSEHEDARIHNLRCAQAIVLRMTIAKWINDRTISDLDFAFWLHKYTYDDSRRLLQYALKIEKGEI